jgi:hypothetical protein
MMAAMTQASPVVSNVLLNLFLDGVHPNEIWMEFFRNILRNYSV